MINRKLFLLLIVSIFTLTTSAVNFSFSDGIRDAALKRQMELKVTSLLNEFNAAQSAGRNLDFHVVKVNTDVQNSLAMLWETTPFSCDEEEVVEHCLTTGTGYQVRNIPLMMKPTEPGLDEDEMYQEAVINFDKRGNIVSFYMSISMNLYMNVVKQNVELTDLRRRQQILDYVERFRTAYNERNMPFLEQVFSDKALIITGRVITTKTHEGGMSQDVIYNQQSKKQYLSKLSGVFKTVKYIKVVFDDIDVLKHPTNPNLYGVTLHQGYSTDRYHDEGYVFLLWDFSNENSPQIHVRTWQSDRLNGKQISKDDVFSFVDVGY